MLDWITQTNTGVAVWAYGFGFERFGAIKAMYFAVVTLTSYVKSSLWLSLGAREPRVGRLIHLM